MHKSCSVEGCTNKYYGKGFCSKHYQRNRSHGAVHDRKWHHGVSAQEKFMRSVDRNGASVTPVGTPCWLWTEGLSASGYGKVWWNGETLRANRVAWIIWKGRIPRGKCVLHKCDTPACVNPDHLFLGTNAANTKDRVAKGRSGRQSRNRGENSGRAKLMDAEVLAIRADSRSHKAVAADYHMDPSTICDIRNRRIWKHLP